MSLIFPSPHGPRTVVTPTIREAMQRIFAAHRTRGQMVVMTGKAGAGKTTAALHIVDEVNEAANAESENSFKAEHYVATELRRSRGDALHKRFLAEFARQVLQLTFPSDTRSIDMPALMNGIASGLRRLNIQLVFIDEAGHLPPAALDTLATLINIVATSEAHPLTIGLVGMHDLPTNVQQLPQVERRVTEFIHFQPLDDKTALKVLHHVDPYFRTLDVESQDGRAVMDYLLSPEVSDGGLIGLVVPLAERAASYAKNHGLEMGLLTLKTAFVLKSTDAGRARKEMQRAWGSGK